jgi:Cu/Ag efflux protein CusF
MARRHATPQADGKRGMTFTMLRTTPALRLALVIGALVIVPVAYERVWPSSIAHAGGSETYSSRGVVKSFGADRKYVNIAHEKIPGYMEAMTMSFEPRTVDQLGSLAVGDRVAFTFTATEDGRRVLQSIQRDAPRTGP